MSRRRPVDLRDESGIALVMAMLVLTALALTLSSLVYFTSSNQRTSNYAKQVQAATSLAEAGINNAMAVLTNPANAPYLEKKDLLPSRTTTYTGGTVIWRGTLTGETWQLTSTATVSNPTGPSAAAIRKTMTAKVRVRAPKPGALTLDIWNWIYSPKTGDPSGCDTTIDQNATIKVPLWVGGNLCLNNGGNVQNPINDDGTRGGLYVGGQLYSKNNASKVGTNSAPLDAAYVRNGCQLQVASNPYVNPCRNDSGAARTNVWVKPYPAAWTATTLPPQFATIQLLPVQWSQWYDYASPGPQHPCEVQSGAPPTFDNTINAAVQWGPTEGYSAGSVPGQVNLTPDGTSYTCKTGNGELSWDATTRKLTVAGAIFIDGSAQITTSGNAPIQYVGPVCSPGASQYDICNTNTGQAVVYLTGTLAMQGVRLCAVLTSNGNDCDQNAWDPNTRLLVFSTYSTGGFLTAGNGIEVTTSSHFQGALYAEGNLFTGQTSWTQGPLVSATGVVVGQQNTIFFPKLTIVPLSMPMSAPTKYWVEAPYDFTG